VDAEGLKELFQPFGAVVVKRMFGGHGVYHDGLMFSLEIEGEVYLKTDAETESAFAAAGATPFIYQGHSRPIRVSFWRLVAGAYDDADELKRWCGLAIDAARRAAEAKAQRATPKTRRRPAGRAKPSRKH
jgi:DNA transformation protein and related proteins